MGSWRKGVRQERKGPRKRKGLAKAGERRPGLARPRHLGQAHRRRKLVGEPEGEGRQQRDEASGQGCEEVKKQETGEASGSCHVTRSLEENGGLGIFKLCCDDGRSLRQLGVMMAWLVSHGMLCHLESEALTALPRVLPPMVFQGAGIAAVHRTLKKGTLPIRLYRRAGSSCGAAETLQLSGDNLAEFSCRI